MTLTRSADRKVTNLPSPNGKTAKIANSFGLPAGKAFACPGATSFCERICYAGKLEKIYKGVRNVLTSNFEQILYADYLGGIPAMRALLVQMVEEFVAECDKRGADKYFRIHWDGDFYSEAYAQAWADTINLFPAVQFWVYTRSFTPEMNVLPIITQSENLTVYLSADPVNIALANAAAMCYNGVYIATVADTFAEARDTIIDTARKSYPCPENGKRIPLITEKGSACGRCGICIDGRGDVLFSVKKR
jgi:hypothetical protein